MQQLPAAGLQATAAAEPASRAPAGLTCDLQAFAESCMTYQCCVRGCLAPAFIYTSLEPVTMWCSGGL